MERTPSRSLRATRSVAVMNRRRRMPIFFSLRSVANVLECLPTVLWASSRIARSKVTVRLSCCRSESGAALVGREDDLRSIATSAKERGNLACVRARGHPEIINLADKCITFEISDRLITTNTKPIWLKAMGQKLARPILETLTDQEKARYSDEDQFRFQRLSDPIGRQALASAARHDQATACRRHRGRSVPLPPLRLRFDAAWGFVLLVFRFCRSVFQGLGPKPLDRETANGRGQSPSCCASGDAY